MPMEKKTENLLEKILLPLNTQWEVLSVETNELLAEVLVNLRYKFDYIEEGGVRYPIYDYRKERTWRHLDLWQYKTYLVAQIPRYKDNHGFFKSVDVPWAAEYDRLTRLLKKKR